MSEHQTREPEKINDRIGRLQNSAVEKAQNGDPRLMDTLAIIEDLSKSAFVYEGIPNIGRVCYITSVIQAFVPVFIHHEQELTNFNTSQCSTNAKLYRLFQNTKLEHVTKDMISDVYCELYTQDDNPIT